MRHTRSFKEPAWQRNCTNDGVRRLLVGGLATDYCVKETVLDGLKYGFEVFYLEDASERGKR